MNEFLLKRIEPFLKRGDIKVDNKEASNFFNDYISENYPWAPLTSHILWDQIADA